MKYTVAAFIVKGSDQVLLAWRVFRIDYGGLHKKCGYNTTFVNHRIGKFLTVIGVGKKNNFTGR
jgi:hypothetical protein